MYNLFCTEYDLKFLLDVVIFIEKNGIFETVGICFCDYIWRLRKTVDDEFWSPEHELQAELWLIKVRWDLTKLESLFEHKSKMPEIQCPTLYFDAYCSLASSLLPNFSGRFRGGFFWSLSLLSFFGFDDFFPIHSRSDICLPIFRNFEFFRKIFCSQITDFACPGIPNLVSIVTAVLSKPL